jgi:hypothetical protein
MSAVSDESVGQNCRQKFNTLKKPSELRSSSAVSGLMKSIFGAAVGAGCPVNCESR